jgi:hypothetical protein
MLRVIARVAGLLAWLGSYLCFQSVFIVWKWIETNGHTEGSPAGLGIFAIGVGADFFLIIIGCALALLGCFCIFSPRKRSGGRDRGRT